MTRYKQPVSVLVVIYTDDLEVLLLERADYPGYWQSVTGSCEPGEALRDTALREVREETGMDASQYALSDWQAQNDYEIYPHWRYRYPPGITRNTEHVFGLQLPHRIVVQLTRGSAGEYQADERAGVAGLTLVKCNSYAEIIELVTAYVDRIQKHVAA